MKKFIFSIIGIIGFTLVFSGSVFAQVMMGNNAVTSDDHTAREEAEGKAVWEKLQAKQTTCADLSEDNFGTLGEYFMGTMLGTSHESMNNMMIAMMGEQGEEQMHVVMGKRLSGCDKSAAIPSQGIGFMSTMNSMMGGWSSPIGSNQSNNSMMNFGNNIMGGWFGFGWIFMILWWVLIIAGIVTLIKWLMSQSKNSDGESALDILKARYAKGEIDKKEFEDKKKDLS